MWDQPFYYQPFGRQGSHLPLGGASMVGEPITRGSYEHSAKASVPPSHGIPVLTWHVHGLL
jgi:hypothetical protein